MAALEGQLQMQKGGGAKGGYKKRMFKLDKFQITYKGKNGVRSIELMGGTVATSGADFTITDSVSPVLPLYVCTTIKKGAIYDFAWTTLAIRA